MKKKTDTPKQKTKPKFTGDVIVTLTWPELVKMLDKFVKAQINFTFYNNTFEDKLVIYVDARFYSAAKKRYPSIFTAKTAQYGFTARFKLSGAPDESGE